MLFDNKYGDEESKAQDRNIRLWFILGMIFLLVFGYFCNPKNQERGESFIPVTDTTVFIITPNSVSTTELIPFYKGDIHTYYFYVICVSKDAEYKIRIEKVGSNPQYAGGSLFKSSRIQSFYEEIKNSSEKDFLLSFNTKGELIKVNFKGKSLDEWSLRK